MVGVSFRSRIEAPINPLQISHDDVQSMLETFAMWVDKDSIDLTGTGFAADQLSTLAFLFGGVGDGKHAVSCVNRDDM